MREHPAGPNPKQGETIPKATNKSNTSRRAFLSVLAAAISAAAVATGSVATLAATAESDPILAAIEAHRTATAAYQAL